MAISVADVNLHFENKPTSIQQWCQELHRETGKHFNPICVVRHLFRQGYLDIDARAAKQGLSHYAVPTEKGKPYIVNVGRHNGREDLIYENVFLTNRGADLFRRSILVFCFRGAQGREYRDVYLEEEKRCYAERMGGETLLKWQIGEL